MFRPQHGFPCTINLVLGYPLKAYVNQTLSFYIQKLNLNSLDFVGAPGTDTPRSQKKSGWAFGFCRPEIILFKCYVFGFVEAVLVFFLGMGLQNLEPQPHQANFWSTKDWAKTCVLGLLPDKTNCVGCLLQSKNSGALFRLSERACCMLPSFLVQKVRNKYSLCAGATESCWLKFYLPRVLDVYLQCLIGVFW